MYARQHRVQYICARCGSRQLRRLHSSDKSSQALPLPPPSGAARLTNRKLISLHGLDTPKFLQGIVTNDVKADNKHGFYAAFLTAQGRVLHDVFVYPTQGSLWHKQQNAVTGDEEPGYLIEVDAEQVESLMKHLKRHKLRSKLKIRSLEDGELDVWSVWKEGDRWIAHGQSQVSGTDDGIMRLTDGRAPGMGQRLLLPPASATTVMDEVRESPLSAYTIRRYLRGVAEGQKEMPRDDCLPMNCNIDLMGGIDFKKGCYVGQELTIRTHHTGVVRRRILPISFYITEGSPPDKVDYDPSFRTSLSESDDLEIRRDDKRQRKTGRIVGSIGNLGLGMCRLEQMSDLIISGEGNTHSADDRFMFLTWDNQKIGIKAFVPDWIRGGIREPKVQKRVQ